MRRSDVIEAAAVLRRVLDAIERGELDARPAERNRLEGALVALEALAAPTVKPAPRA